jgi:hypothetical protein
MSDTKKDEPQQEQPQEEQQPPGHDGIGGGFGELVINDDLVEVHRHPDNAHIDRPKDPPEAA